MKQKKQQGMSLLSLLVVGVLLACVGVVAAQMVPTAVEYMAITKAAQKASGGTTVAEVRSIFDSASQIDDIKSISAKDLEIGKEGDRVVVSFAYTREIHLAGPAYLLMKYEGKSK